MSNPDPIDARMEHHAEQAAFTVERDIAEDHLNAITAIMKAQNTIMKDVEKLMYQSEKNRIESAHQDIEMILYGLLQPIWEQYYDTGVGFEYTEKMPTFA